MGFDTLGLYRISETFYIFWMSGGTYIVHAGKIIRKKNPMDFPFFIF